MRPIDTENADPFYADLEKEMLEKINELGIGPQGINIEEYSSLKSSGSIEIRLLHAFSSTVL